MTTRTEQDAFYEYMIDSIDFDAPNPPQCSAAELEQQYQYWLKLKKEEALGEYKKLLERRKK